jgi:hypothetical protein
MKKETGESTMSGSSGSFAAPMGFVTKKEIYKIHNKKKYNEEDTTEGEFTEAMTASVSAAGMYDAPFGDGSGGNPLKIGGEKTVKKRMKTMRKKKFPMWGGPDGVYVAIKEKCKKFPYCNQGVGLDNLEFYENDQLNESVKVISKKYGLPATEVEKLVIKEIKRIFI